MSIYKCPFCIIIPPDLDNLKKHIQREHKTLSQLGRCPHENCQYSFSNLYLYFKHVEKHSEVSTTNLEHARNDPVGEEASKNVPQTEKNLKRKLNRSPTNHDISETNADDFNDVLNIPNVMTHQKSSSSTDNLVEFGKQQLINASKLVLKLYEDPSLSRTAVQKVIRMIDEYQRDSVDSLKKLASTTSPIKENTNIAYKVVQKSFSNFKTEHRTFNYLRDNNLLIEPVAVVVGQQTLPCKTKNPILEWLPVKTKIYTVPMKEVLKKFLELPNVFSTVTESLGKSNNGFPMESVLQTQSWQNIKSRSPDAIVIPISLYFDDFEINNPLGSHRLLKKMGAVYYTISCLPPEFASKLDSWFLAQLHKEQDYKRLGNKKIFMNLKKQLLELRDDGIEITIDDKKYKVFFHVAKILGDNLGLNQMLGFVSSFRAKHFCRICRASITQTQHLIQEDSTLLRNKLNYQRDVNKANLTKKSSHGVKEEFVFESVFDLFKFPTLDPMHDLLEGICRYEMISILKKLIERGYFDVKTLNNKIRTLNVNLIRGVNKPPPLNQKLLDKDQWKLSASEMAFLLEYLVILVGEYVPLNSDVWELYLLLRKIYFLVMSPIVKENSAERLTDLIMKHHQQYKNLFGSLKPKHHFLIHYPRAMEMLGPLRYAAALRGEAVHSIFKRYAVTAKSRVNPAYTLAARHQLSLARRFMDKDPMVNKKSNKYKKTIKLNSLKNYKKFEVVCPVEGEHQVELLSWANYDGIVYKTGTIVVIRTIDDIPIFGEVISIIKANEIIYFIINEFQTLNLNQHFEAYEVEKIATWTVMERKNLVTHLIFQSHSINVPDKKIVEGEETTFARKKVIAATYV